MRAFLVISILCLAYSAMAQQPEKVIGAPADSTIPWSKDTITPPQVIINTPVQKPTVQIDSIGPRKHSPKTATLLSLAIPGAGQVYNRNNWWWKVPIIYGGGAALVYGAIFYQKNYKEFQQAYEFTVLNPGVPTGKPRFDQYSDRATLISYRNTYKQSRDQCIIGIAVLYALQVVDAAVEAHFFEFSVSEDLSLNVQPQIVFYGPNAYSGVQLTFRLTK